MPQEAETIRHWVWDPNRQKGRYALLVGPHELIAVEQLVVDDIEDFAVNAGP